MTWYKLVDRKPVAITFAEHLSMGEDLESFERDKRRRALRRRRHGRDLHRLSRTRPHHSHGREGPPILFESMVFGGPLDGEMKRYATWEEAERGHAELVARAMFAAKELEQ